MAVKDGVTKLAQYGQWDGYPSGQGVEVLSFIRSKQRLAKLSKALDRAVFLTQAQLDSEYKKVGVTGDFMSENQAVKFNKRFPLLSRDNSARVLSMMIDMDKPELVNEEMFAGDSLFCEWAYVIDFDKRVFEVYKGFNLTEPLEPNDRFYKTPRTHEDYHQVRKIAEFSFDSLPTKSEFFKYLADH
jgi:hypothetical protein